MHKSMFLTDSSLSFQVQAGLLVEDVADMAGECELNSIAVGGIPDPPWCPIPSGRCANLPPYSRRRCGLRQLQTIRASEPVFRADAKISTFDTGSNRVLGVRRELAGERFLGLFNFSEQAIPVVLEKGIYRDLVQERRKTQALAPYGFVWMKEEM